MSASAHQAMPKLIMIRTSAAVWVPENAEIVDGKILRVGGIELYAQPELYAYVGSPWRRAKNYASFGIEVVDGTQETSIVRDDDHQLHALGGTDG